MASQSGVRPVPEFCKSNAKEKEHTFSQIVSHASKPMCFQHPTDLPRGQVITPITEYITVDSGACDSIIPPHTFTHATHVHMSSVGRMVHAGVKQSLTLAEKL